MITGTGKYPDKLHEQVSKHTTDPSPSRKHNHRNMHVKINIKRLHYWHQTMNDSMSWLNKVCPKV